MKNFIQPGNTITPLESLLAHPAHGDGLVDSGDQVVVGTIIGVAAVSALAATELIPVATTGVFNLPVEAKTNAGAGSAVAYGDKLYIDPAAAGKINKDTTKTLFGIALGGVVINLTTNIDVMLTGF